MHSQRRDVDQLFLLALAPLSVAGCPGIEGTDEGGSGSTTSTSPATTGSEAGSAATESGMPTSDETVTSTSSSETSGGDNDYVDCNEVVPPQVGEISAVCEEYGSLLEQCYQPGEDCQPIYAAYCQDYLDHAATLGAECLSLLEEYYACITDLDCAALRERRLCEAEFDAFYDPCGPG